MHFAYDESTHPECINVYTHVTIALEHFHHPESSPFSSTTTHALI